MAKLKVLNKINQNVNFLEYREKKLFDVLKSITIGGIVLFFVWFVLDLTLFKENILQFIILRGITITAYFLNFIIAFINKKRNLKLHLYIGFYLSAFTWSILTTMTASHDFIYWFGIIFIIVAWHMMVPLSYIKLIVHSLIFIIIFNIILVFFSGYILLFRSFFLLNLVFVVVDLLATIVSVGKNESDMNDFTNSKTISEQVAKLEEANSQLHKFSLVINQAPAAVIIANCEGIIEYVNPFFCKITCSCDCDAIGKHFSAIHTSPSAAVQFELMWKAIQNGETWHGEFLDQCGDEKYWVLSMARPYADSKNIQQGYIIIQQDITEQKELQSQLSDSEKKYRMLIEKSLDAITITQDSKFVLVNKAFCDMLGYSETEVLALKSSDLIPPEEAERMLEMNNRLMAGEIMDARYNCVLLTKDKQRITVEMCLTTIHYNGSKASFTTARDITQRLEMELELKQAKEQLEEANRDLWLKVKERTDELTQLNTRLLKMEKENIQSQFEMLKQQVNPHFLFNSLNVLTSLIKLEPNLAEKFTEQLSKVYRYVLENKEKELVSLATELSFLNAYSFLLDIRFKDKLKVNITISEVYLERLVLPLALQLLIENAIKHNTFSKKSPLIVHVFIDENDYLTVVNNLQIRESHFASTGVGLVNIQNRYMLLSEKNPVFEKTTEKFIAKIPLL